MKPTILYDMPEEQYHAETGIGEGLYCTRSMICDYILDPPSYDLKHNKKDPQMQFEGNEGTKFGNYVESWILDRDVSQYAVKPQTCWSKSKKAIVDWNLRGSQMVLDADGEPTSIDTREWESMNPNTITKDQEDLARFLEIRFNETALGQYWLKKIPEAKKQVVMRWTDKESEIDMQIRLDCYDKGKLASDLKSTGKSLSKWNDSVHDFGYHYQQAIYSDGIVVCENLSEYLPFSFAVGETKKLKRARIKNAHPDAVAFARRTYKSALVGIAAGKFDAHDKLDTIPQSDPLPSYLHYQYNDEN